MTENKRKRVEDASSHQKWEDIDWYKAQREVRRLQVRIVKATKEGKWRRVKNLQRLLTHSRAAKVIAVRRVTENQGRRTAGVDGQLWSTPQKKMQGVEMLKHAGYKPKPSRRVYIPKGNGENRALGIWTMKDRAMQALWLQALDPISETLADANSYGFRKERSVHDALGQCFIALGRKSSAQWIAKLDIKGCFDHLSHEWLKSHIPMKKAVLKKWLKAGYREGKRKHETGEGTPQGGVISPVLANMALDGLQSRLDEEYVKYSGKARVRINPKKINMIRYADDLLITGATREVLEKQVIPMIEEFLAERGLELSGSKTEIKHISEGIDFLGFHLKKHKGKLRYKPTRKAEKQVRGKIKEVLRQTRGMKAIAVVKKMNPILRGWTNYYKHVMSSRAFNSLEHWLWEKLWKWAKRRHDNKSRTWIFKKYFRRWESWNYTFYGEDREGKKCHQYHPGGVRYQRYRKIKGKANPYDPEWEIYFEKREADKWRTRRDKQRISKLYKSQQGRCPVCRERISQERGWHIHHIDGRQGTNPNRLSNLILLHPNCHRQVHSQGWKIKKLGVERC